MGYTLSDLVKEYCIEIGDHNFNRAARFYTYATSGLREIAMDVSGTTQCTEIYNNGNNTFDLPEGFISYLNIAVVDDKGFLHGLGKNERINLTKQYNNCGVPTQKVSKQNMEQNNGWLYGVLNPTYIASHWRNGENYGAYFNAGGHNRVGGYRVDYEANQIQLGEIRCNANYLILEYLGDISIVNGDYIVHPYIIETIKAYIYWKSIQRDRNFNLGEKQLAEAEFKKQRGHSIHRFNQATAQEWLDAFRKSASGIPKW